MSCVAVIGEKLPPSHTVNSTLRAYHRVDDQTHFYASLAQCVVAVKYYALLGQASVLLA